MPDLTVLSPDELARLADKAGELKRKKKGTGSGRKVGRPKMLTEPMIDTSVYIPLGDWDLLLTAAKNLGTNRAALHRKIMRDWLTKNGYRK